MSSNSGKYNNERRIFYFQDALALRGPRGSLNWNIDIFCGGGGGGWGGAPEREARAWTEPLTGKY